MDVLVLIGRILFALLFLYSAVGHLTQHKQLGAYAASKGVPAAEAATLLSGLLMLLGGLSVLLGVWADLGALLIAAFLFPTALIMHAFWKETDPQTRQTEQISFLKDTALGGAALVMTAFFAHAGHDLGLTLTGPLLSMG
ncbi:DoxX family membrane protein [Streptomyces sp. ICN441]|uniref:DoxX family membrane protein n=1 Tax=Streptomyces tirandamycinicus TaxID=2174846 RepID=A0A2S1T0K6_9ACTN|nr:MULTISPECIES: DoxX family membrane protein [Streptomyces]AWI32146.1 DoxX family membrane protein [Streptomyces tirandamycinicus]MCY0983938.1 DoxX family membrane protein [Streptomyces tirandamycinicus]NNJ08222.1 DoxX family membrane protein [Streptomyces sp. PKU-MA01144]TFE36192.1 DoxX family membrane protein [Streptomyces sp. ICN441]